MSRLFISYRRADCPGTVQALYERLKKRLPRWTLFYDHKALVPGEAFPERIHEEVTSSTVVLVVIGPRWVDSLIERRSQPAIDHVREEVRLALSAGNKVIPIVVENATMPREPDLAEFPELQPLLKLNGRLVRPDPDFDHDTERLCAYLDELGPGVGTGTVLAGKYKILREIGQGGMGVVYESEQIEPRRTVAVKMVLEGMDTKEVLARFDGEKEALARMDHPNIARVIDSGSSPSGKPYFVMEFVKGEPITTYCDRKRLHPNDRLELFRLVCSAVQHAHQKGIIHRDIKPSNVLVEEVDGRPVPKVIDFGLAKALSGKLTFKTLVSDLGKTVGTLLYSSPEQAAGRQFDVDTRTDVYSLGVLLYELLAGQPPYSEADLKQVGDEAMRREIIEREPPKPSTKLSSSNALPSIAANRQLEPAKLTRLVRGELDWIALRALEKEPNRRYETANQLSDDIERYLNHEPVKAGKPSTLYRLKKFVRRNRMPVVAAGLVLFVLLAGIAGTTYGLFLAEVAREEERKAKDRETDRAEGERKAKDEAIRLEGVAKGKESDATREVRKAQRLLGMMAITEGLKLADEGKLSLALLQFAHALEVAPESPEIERMARTQIVTFRRYSGSKYRLTQIFVHEGEINSAVYSSDGRRVLTGSTDKTARVWNAETGKPITPPLQHKGWVYSVSFSPDGRRALTGSYDGTARVWDAETGKPVTTPLQHKDIVWAVSFSPDGRQVVTGSNDKTARVWNAETGNPVTPYLRHENQVLRVAFSSDGRRVLTGSSDKTARIWDAETGKPITPPLQHSGGVDSVSFSPNGRRALTGSYDKTARVWDAETGKPVSPPLQHAGSVWSASFSPDGRRVVTGSVDGTARVWDAETGKPITPPLEHEGFVKYVSYSPDGRLVVTGSYDSRARVWDAETGKPVSLPLQHAKAVVWVSFSPDGRRILTGSDDKTARIWDVESSVNSVTLTQSPLYLARDYGPGSFQGPSNIRPASFSPDGRRVLTGTSDGAARVWDMETGNPITPPLQHGDEVTSASFSPDGQRLLIGSFDMARVWDAESGKPITPPFHRAGAIKSMSFSPDGRRVATRSYDKTVRVWDAETGKPISPALQHSNYVNSVSFSPDGCRVLTGSLDNIAQVWDAETGKPITPPLQHSGSVDSVSFSHDGRRVLTGSWDKTARVWDAETGKPVTPPLKHEGSVRSVSFSPNDSRIVTGSNNSTARVWDVETGKPITPPLKHDSGTISVSFSPDGRCILTWSYDKTVRVWDAETGKAITPPLIHSSALSNASFGSVGQSVLSFSRDQTIRNWSFASDDRPLLDLIGLAQIACAHRIDNTGAIVPLMATELSRLWDEMHNKYPQEFSVSPQKVRHWRESEIRDCLNEGNLRAAQFHYWALFAELASGKAK